MAKVEWDNWEVIERILPPSWETKAKETGTLRRCRGFANASQLLRVMMIHLVDGSLISEPGSTGSNWRLHYSATLPSLHCDEVLVTGPEVGESFSRYTVQPGDLLIGDRGLAHRKGIRHVLEGGGDVIVRLNLTNVPLMDDQGQRFNLLSHLCRLHGTQVGNWPVILTDEHGQVRGRVWAIKKSRAATARAPASGPSGRTPAKDTGCRIRRWRPRVIFSSSPRLVRINIRQHGCWNSTAAAGRWNWLSNGLNPFSPPAI